MLELKRIEVAMEYYVGKIHKTENGLYECFEAYENGKEVQYVLDTNGNIHRYEL